MATPTKNFSLSEFNCHCGCGLNNINQKIINLCQIIRDEVKSPIKINSGCRCNTYNKKVGGATGSFHTTGQAADLSCNIGAKNLFAIICDLKAKNLLPDIQYAILYIQKNFVHIDIGKKRTRFFEIRP